MAAVTAQRVKELFHKVYGDSQNFMTPEVLRYGVAGPYGYELSWGHGLFGGIKYGVTVLLLNGEKRHDLSAGGFTLEEAEEHIRKLRSGELEEEVDETEA